MTSIFHTPAKLKIKDDSGFIAVVNREKYLSFVDEDWEFDQLQTHFINQMNDDTLIIWATGFENEWTVYFATSPSGRKSAREFTKQIQITNGYLYLTNYEDLTMAAQFSDYSIPLKNNADLFIEIENGLYEVTVRQMFNSMDFNAFAENEIGFEIIFQRAINNNPQKVEKIFWT